MNLQDVNFKKAGCMANLLMIIVFVLLFQPFSILIAGENSTYSFSWLDPDKEVYVIQNRKYTKRSKLHISGGGGITTSGSFVDSNVIQARVGFFFNEDWGFEGMYAKSSGNENTTAESVRNSGSAGSTPFRRIVEDYMGVMLLWSPFYGKFNVFNKIIYMDLILGLGYAKLDEHNNREELINQGMSPYEEQYNSHNGIIWETTCKFYISKTYHIRTDLTVVHYNAKKALASADELDTTYYSNYDLALSLGLNF